MVKCRVTSTQVKKSHIEGLSVSVVFFNAVICDVIRLMMRAHLCFRAFMHTWPHTVRPLWGKQRTCHHLQSSQTCLQISLKASLHSLVLTSFFPPCCHFRFVPQYFQTAASQKTQANTE